MRGSSPSPASVGDATLIVARLLLAPVGPDLASELTATLPETWPLPDAESREAAARLAEVLAAPAREQEWIAEWERVFRGHGASVVSPYESVNTNEDELVCGESCDSMREWFRSCGVAFPGEGREPEDHVGLQINLLGLLLHASTDSADALDATRRFFHEHPARWVRESIAEPLITESESPIYECVGVMLRATLDAVQVILESA